MQTFAHGWHSGKLFSDGKADAVFLLRFALLKTR
jgi:hypothetical protein